MVALTKQEGGRREGPRLQHCLVVLLLTSKDYSPHASPELSAPVMVNDAAYIAPEAERL